MAEIPKEVAKQLDSTQDNSPAEKILHENKGERRPDVVASLGDSVTIHDGPTPKLNASDYAGYRPVYAFYKNEIDDTIAFHNERTPANAGFNNAVQATLRSA